MVHENRAQLTRQERRTAELRLGAVARVVRKKLVLSIQSGGHRLFRVNVALSAVHNRHVAKAQWNHAAGKDIDDIRALVHQVHLGQHTHRATAIDVHFRRELQTIRVCQVRVGGRHRQNDRVRLGDVLEQHIPDLPLNVLWLVTYRVLGQTW